jgi:hypothetical protein
MVAPDSEHAALSIVEQASEDLTYALLRNDRAAAAVARRRIRQAREKIASARATRLGPAIKSVLDEADASGPDPLAAALAGGLTYQDLTEYWERGDLDEWLTDKEHSAVKADAHALRLVLSARARGVEFAEVSARDQQLRHRDGFALAARTTSRTAARAVAKLIEQSEAASHPG